MALYTKCPIYNIQISEEYCPQKCLGKWCNKCQWVFKELGEKDFLDSRKFDIMDEEIEKAMEIV